MYYVADCLSVLLLGPGAVQVAGLQKQFGLEVVVPSRYACSPVVSFASDCALTRSF